MVKVEVQMWRKTEREKSCRFAGFGFTIKQKKTLSAHSTAITITNKKGKLIRKSVWLVSFIVNFQVCNFCHPLLTWDCRKKKSAAYAAAVQPSSCRFMEVGEKNFFYSVRSFTHLIFLILQRKKCSKFCGSWLFHLFSAYTWVVKKTSR